MTYPIVLLNYRAGHLAPYSTYLFSEYQNAISRYYDLRRAWQAMHGLPLSSHVSAVTCCVWIGTVVVKITVEYLTPLPADWKAQLVIPKG